MMLSSLSRAPPWPFEHADGQIAEERQNSTHQANQRAEPDRHIERPPEGHRGAGKRSRDPAANGPLPALSGAERRQNSVAANRDADKVGGAVVDHRDAQPEQHPPETVGEETQSESLAHHQAEIAAAGDGQRPVVEGLLVLILRRALRLGHSA